jgi:NAD(P)-dependent dehydrogenase (short-subunit alcohol dehydrogenase family)
VATAAVDPYGGVDVLVNNAAIGDGDDILATDEATWDRVLAVVLKSVFLCTAALLPRNDRAAAGSDREHFVGQRLGRGSLQRKAGVINLTQELDHLRRTHILLDSAIVLLEASHALRYSDRPDEGLKLTIRGSNRDRL